ncbi:MAG: hypothetical protein E7580_09060 [Ruminococcaceae bacterium]|nr:hypothetical protein [Oscillospiraceae bacterium]
MQTEKNYDFRKRYCKVHSRIPYGVSTEPREGELALKKQISIACYAEGIVVKTALRDFQRYLKTAFGITARLVDGKADLEIAPVTAKGDYMERKVTVSADGVRIIAADERGIAQALYDLEDAMNRRRAPCFCFGTTVKKPRFSPRMTHSGIGLDLFTDEYLSACAHHGYDAVLAFMHSSPRAEPADVIRYFNDLVERASKYGIDVYAYSKIRNFVHPDEDGAREAFDRSYGDVFRAIPGLKGMVFVGESIQFPTKDPNANPIPHPQQPADGIPDVRPRSGWWPCFDYTQWISMARDSIRAAKPDADVVLWSYNWGRQREDARVALLETLPTDIALLVTFEMFDLLDLGNSKGMVCDYTVSHVGPGTYFASEAEVAKRRGIPLYAMVNTAGRTWDFGVAPYEPFPWQWNARHEQILLAREKYGLQGLMESHHFGFLPSFISEQAKEAFTEGGMSFPDYMESWSKCLAGDEWEKVLKGMRSVDASIRYYVASSENQYGPYRVGPAYPFCLKSAVKKPDKPGVYFGNRICTVMNLNRDISRCDPYSMRVRDELRLHRKALGYTRDGLRILKSVKHKTSKLKRLIDLVDFLAHCHETAVNHKEFYILRTKLLCCTNHDSLTRTALRIEKVCRRELVNVEKTIPLVQRNSDFGFESSMDYQCDEECLRWKCKHMEYVLGRELPAYIKK